MIKYKLICKNCDDYFDSWFSSSKEYEKLKKQRFLNCPICNSFNIEKTLMSPNVLRSKINVKDENNKYKKIEEKYQKFIKKNFDYVGENFAYEARSIHYKDKKPLKGIYGSTTKEELQELTEEGVEVKEIPWKKHTIN
tara:strand:- start:363 stop:776 length:414 start_codon:yes stop_codon:yes gene_type:complete